MSQDTTAGGVVRGYLAEQVVRLAAAGPGLRTGDAEAVHDARVATRRLRTALAVYRPALDRAVGDPVRADLAELGRALGAVRDAQVQRRAYRRRLADEDPELVRGPVAQRLDEDGAAAL